MTISPINLQWSFATNAANTSLGVRNDGSIVSAYQSNSFLDYKLSAAYGQLTVTNGTPGFIFWGTDVDYDSGDPPSVAIDSTGLAVSCHVENGPGSTIYLNFGSANGGQGGFSPPSFETSKQGNYPNITCIGDGLFLIIDMAGNADTMVGWQVQVFSLDTGGYNATVSAITFNDPGNLVSNWPNGFVSPNAVYSNGTLAIADQAAELNIYLGTYDTTTAVFTLKCFNQFENELANGDSPACSIAIGSSNDIYFAIAGSNYNTNNNQLIFYYGTYTQGTSWSLSVTQQTLLGDVNFGNYAQAVGMGYVSVDGYDGIILSVLGESNCIDIFVIPLSQFTS